MKIVAQRADVEHVRNLAKIRISFSDRLIPHMAPFLHDYLPFFARSFRRSSKYAIQLPMNCTLRALPSNESEKHK